MFLLFELFSRYKSEYTPVEQTVPVILLVAGPFLLKNKPDILQPGDMRMFDLLITRPQVCIFIHFGLNE